MSVLGKHAQVSNAVRSFQHTLAGRPKLGKLQRALTAYGRTLGKAGLPIARVRSLAECIQGVDPRARSTVEICEGIEAGLRHASLYPRFCEDAGLYVDRYVMPIVEARDTVRRRSGTRARKPSESQVAKLIFEQVSTFLQSASNGILGLGATASVRSCDTLMWGSVAQKELPWGSVADPIHCSALHLAMNELRFLMTPPPGAVRIHDIKATEHGITLTMQRMQGPTLRDWSAEMLGRDATPVDLWREYASTMRASAVALQGIHDSYIIHADVKPENMFLDGSSVRYGDFAAALRVSEVATRGFAMGTELFVAPEVKRSRELSYRSDLYALGASYVGMIYGDSPRGLLHIAPSMLREDLPIPSEFDALVDRMLSPNPDQRPNSATEVAQAIDAMLTNPA